MARIDEAQARLDRLRAMRADIPIGADTAEADRKIEELQAKLDELKAKEREQGGGAEGFRRLGEEVGKVREETDRLIGRASELKGKAVEAFDKAKGKAEEFGHAGKRAGEDAASGLDKAAKSGNNLQGVLSKISGYQGFGGLIGMGAALVPALMPVLGTLTIGVAAFTSALGAATLGFGALGILAMPILSEVKASMTTLAPLQKAWMMAQPGPAQVQAWKNIQTAIDKLPPSQRDVIRGIFDLKKQMYELSQEIHPQVMQLFTASLGLLHDILPTLVAPAKEAALGLTSLVNDMHSHLPQWQHFVDVMTKQVQPAITGFGVAFGKFGVGIGRIMMAFAPLAQRFEGDLINIANRFEAFAARLNTPQGLARMVDYLNKNGPLIHQVLDSLWKDIELVAKAAGKFGPAELAGIKALLDAIGKVAAIPGLGPVIINLLLFASVISKLIGPLGKLMQGFLFMGNVASKLPMFARGLWAIGAAAVAAVPEIIAFASALWATGIPEIIIGVVALGAALYMLVTHFKTVSSFLHSGWGTAISAAIAVLMPFIGIPMLIMGHWQAVWNFLKGLGAWFAGPFVHFFTGLPGQIMGALGAIGRFFQRLPGQIIGFLSRLPGDLLHLAESAGSSLLNGIIKYGPQVLLFFATLGPRIIGYLVAWASQMLAWGVQAIVFLFNGIVSAAPLVWNFFISLPGKVIGFVESLVGMLLSFGIRALTALWNGITSAAGAVWDFFTALPGRALGLVEHLAGDLLSFGARALTDLWNGITSAAGAVWDFFSSLPQKVLGFLEALPGEMLGMGARIIEGLAKGVENAAGALFDKIKSVIGKAKDLITSPWNAFSPSRVTMQLGHDIMAGLTLGIGNQVGALMNTVSRIAPLMMGALGNVAGVVNLGLGASGLRGGPASPTVFGGSSSSSALTLGGHRITINGASDSQGLRQLQTLLKTDRQQTLQELAARGFRFSASIPGMT